MNAGLWKWNPSVMVAGGETSVKYDLSHNGVVIPEVDTAAHLRTNIRLLGDLLGETLVHQEGQGLLDLVERVRGLVRESPAAAAELLNSVSLTDATLLARSFSVYFDLANVAEQVERTIDVQSAYRSSGSPLQGVLREAERLGGFTAADVARVGANMSVRPVFTAHPTEAARRSVLLKMRRIADVLLDTSLSPDARRYRLA
jgi:phosphoenolpyruvate carboxylase